MKEKEPRLNISGIVPPLVTPLLKSNQLDIDGLKNLIDHVINGGVSGIFILGTTGEMSRLSCSLKEEMIRQTCKLVNGRVPVLVGITDTSLFGTLKLEKFAWESGANAAVLAPPFYYHVEQNELLSYFREVADTISLPLFLYNMPSRTHITIEIDTVIKAAKSNNIIGIKDSSGDLMYLQNLIYSFKDKPGFSIFVGPEEIMAQAVLSGASGGVNGGANIYPRLYVELFEAARQRNLDKVNELQNIVTQISTTLYRVGRKNPNLTKILKEALYQMNICSQHMEKPYIPFSDEDRGEITSCLNSIVIPEYLKA